MDAAPTADLPGLRRRADCLCLMVVGDSWRRWWSMWSSPAARAASSCPAQQSGQRRMLRAASTHLWEWVKGARQHACNLKTLDGCVAT